jgi:hypothetical protein
LEDFDGLSLAEDDDDDVGEGDGVDVEGKVGDELSELAAFL